ncbi:MAG: class I SAM-dependent methyltransferase [Chloroflexi bacterium]|nr:class I SAM-dependent methyltransferase [Chloroflexota bacterium]
MSLDLLWQQYRAGGTAAVRTAAPAEALDHLYLAILAFSENDFDGALVFAQRAAAIRPSCRVFAQAVIYLNRVVAQGKAGVYVDGEAFAAFIRGGGNVGLYAATSAALSAIYRETSALHLLDIGVGDGMALLPALTGPLARLDLIEPSAPMLERTTGALHTRGIPFQAANCTLQEFMARPAGQWDVMQATFSLQSVPLTDRPAVFGWMRAHSQRVLIAEFDAPDFSNVYHPDRVRYVVERYERGLAEYEGDGGIVAQGFLMPVMFGYFDPTASRTNWEGPISGWGDSLRAAGFDQVQTRKLFNYFWADAYLIDAR